ncbi:3037_t:CDS:2 [Ambispora leptoticha]|uniref:3037_t:CDS:1 n=1 Tax=Ambispora leptoticha TaxID=144679 RepID=A0A9N8WJZ9_9GLOM|nr:3037_t:CDS:2 [Ambispora leptoticha]
MGISPSSSTPRAAYLAGQMDAGLLIPQGLHHLYAGGKMLTDLQNRYTKRIQRKQHSKYSRTIFKVLLISQRSNIEVQVKNKNNKACEYGRIKTRYTCDCKEEAQEEELPILPHERRPNAFYERQINFLREESNSAE